MSDTKLWGVANTPLVYTSKENAEVLAEFLTKNSPNGYKQNDRFKVYEIFPDCYVNKIKRGYETWKVIMERDGTVNSCTIVSGVIPNRYGFNRGSIQVDRYTMIPNTSSYKEHRAIIYTCLAKDKEEAIALCEKYRIKTLIDDIWQGKKREPF